ncbi:MAG: transaldolase [Nibricoccus sp.]
MNRLKQLTTFGQSVWLDFTDRQFVASGELKKLITDDAVTGVTSNPAIFAEAITRGETYQDAVRKASELGWRADLAYEQIVAEDIRAVADELRDVYERTNGRDGYVSVEVSPHLARDASLTVGKAREIWAAIDRPNLYIKVPGTREALPAIRCLVAEGINVNITLLFSVQRYREVAHAYFGGLSDRLASGLSLDKVSSVASFFLSRIDQKVDPLLNDIILDTELSLKANSLRGKAAIACAKHAYQVFKELRSSSIFRRLQTAGAQVQRLLWASTSTKDPKERDVRYVESLTGPDTITTLPLPTLEAFRDHGTPQPKLESEMEDALDTLRNLRELGIDLEGVSAELETQGLEKFVKPFDHAIGILDEKIALAGALLGSTLSSADQFPNDPKAERHSTPEPKPLSHDKFGRD